MIGFPLSILSIVVVGLQVVRFGGDQRGRRSGWIQAVKRVGLLPLGLQALALVLFGFGEMVSGDLSGAGHLLQLAVSLTQAVLAWKRPLEGGLALMIVGGVSGFEFREATARWIMAAPQLISGGVFFSAGLAAWVTSRHRHDQSQGLHPKRISNRARFPNTLQRVGTVERGLRAASEAGTR